MRCSTWAAHGQTRRAADVWIAMESADRARLCRRVRFPAGRSAHLLGGYAAGYYGYMWSQVLALDMLSAFDGKLMNPVSGSATARRFFLRAGNGSLAPWSRLPGTQAQQRRVLRGDATARAEASHCACSASGPAPQRILRVPGTEAAAFERLTQQEFNLRIDRTQLGGRQPLELVPQPRVDAQQE